MWADRQDLLASLWRYRHDKTALYFGLASLAACGAAPQEEAVSEESEPADMCELLALYAFAQYNDDIERLTQFK